MPITFAALRWPPTRTKKLLLTGGGYPQNRLLAAVLKCKTMDWIFKMIFPIIKDCETPEEAEKKVKAWGNTVHPRDAFCGLITVWHIEANWEEFKKRYPNKVLVANGS